MPRYYWKILYDPIGAAGVAVIGINNPHLEVIIDIMSQTKNILLQSVPDSYIVCPPIPNHPILASVSDPTSIYKGFIWACR